MNIKLDENIPASLAVDLSRIGHDVDTVYDEGLAGKADTKVWKAAQDAQRFLITQDLDFSDRRAFASGTHHGILVIRLRIPDRVRLIETVRNLFETEDTEGWAGGFVVATENKIRIRKS